MVAIGVIQKLLILLGIWDESKGTRGEGSFFNKQAHRTSVEMGELLNS